MPLSIKSQNDSFRFEHELKTEMHEDFEYVKSLEKEIDELESEKADFSNIYDLLLEEDLKAQMQDKNIAISELKKLIENCKGKSVETQMVSQKMSYIKWRLLKITLQAPFLNVQKTFDRNRSSLGLHGNDVCSHQFRPRSSSNDF
ncbi:hypothetical protein Tco_0092944 [Tanacetum coccineum]